MTHPYQAISSRRSKMNGSAAPKKISTPTASAQKRNVIKWTKKELEDIAQAAFDLRITDPSITWLAAVRAVQPMVLKMDRVRPIKQERDLENAGLFPIWRDINAKHPDAPLTIRGERPQPEAAPIDIEPAIEHFIFDAGAIARQQAETRELVVKSLLLSTPPGDDEGEDGDGDTEQPAPAEQEPTHAEAAAAAPDADEARRAMVRWTREEQAFIARESKRLTASGVAELDAVRQAVNTLPDERQREIATFGMVRDWIIPMWQQIDAEQRATEAQAQAEQIRREADERARELEAKADPRTLSIDTLLSALVEKLSRRLVDELASAMGERLQDAIMQRVIQTMEHLPASPNDVPEGTTRLHLVPRDHKPRVTVVGLLSQQEQDLEKHFADSIRFTFIKSQKTGGSGHHGGAGLLARGQNADLVVSMIGHAGHDVDEAAKKLNVPFVRRGGKVSGLKRWLTEWLNGEVALAANA